jgi:hypothetical protein
MKNIKGLGLLFLWVSVTAASRVLTHSMLAKFTPVSICFFVFLTTAVFFNILNYRGGVPLIPIIKANLRLIFWLNVFTATTWYFSLLPLKYINASLSSFSIACFSPITGIFIRNYIEPDQLILSILIFIFGTLFYFSFSSSILPFFICFLASSSIATTVYLIKKLNCPTLASISLRFFILILFSFGMIILTGQPLSLFMDNFKIFLLVTLLLGVLPLLFLHQSLYYIDEHFVLIALPFVPVLVYLWEILTYGSVFPMFPNILVVLILTLTLFYNFISIRKIFLIPS